MRTLSCDLCGRNQEMGVHRNADGWSKIKMDHRSGSNIGGAIWAFDLCEKCTGDGKFMNTREKAKSILCQITIENGRLSHD